MTRPFVSVVTPVFNGAEYLSECIESVLAQTHSDFEYLIVDNCSTDDTLNIAQYYSQRDSRIAVLRVPEHLPIIANWNYAVSRISPKSKYCKIVHSDDWIMRTCIEKMVALAESRDSVGVVSAYRIEEAKVDFRGVTPERTVLPGHEVARAALQRKMSVFGSPTSLLIRSDLIRDKAQFYDESVLHADKDLCFRLLEDHDFGFISEILTYTRRHNESITSRTKQFGTRRLESLIMLQRHGPRFFSKPQYEALRQRALGNHHRNVVRLLLSSWDPAVLSFHRRRLSEVGLTLSNFRLAIAFILQLGNRMRTTRKSSDDSGRCKDEEDAEQ